MKNNGNNTNVKDYYVGLDPGSASCGWAVTDFNYNLLKYKGKQMWGSPIYDMAETAKTRRTSRGQRRRLDRRDIRINTLEILFNNEITEVDNTFFRRMHDSNLWLEDKKDCNCKYSLFNDKDFTDKDYLKKYPTIYHLRSELAHSKEPHDVRLVYLAIHHIMKKRGHFLYITSGEDSVGNLDVALKEVQSLLGDIEVDFIPKNWNKFKEELLTDSKTKIKKMKLKEAYGDFDKSNKQLVSILDMLAGAKVKLNVLFNDESLKDIDDKSISLKDDLDEKYDSLSASLEDLQFEILISLKEVFDIARLTQVLGDEEYISDAKIKLYEKNKHDLRLLKEYVKKYHPDKYDLIFNKVGIVDSKNKNEKHDIYLSKGKDTTQEGFCTLLKNELKSLKNETDPELKRIYDEIEENKFLTKLKSNDNGLIPYQIHLKELKTILKNATEYLPFLKEEDEKGLTVADKIISLFTFKVPYYVGPKGENANHRVMITKSNEKIYPWNFDEVVDKKKTAENFMVNLLGRCPYTGDLVLPKDSLIYSRYMLLNELNIIKINGRPLDFETKELIIKKLFEKSTKNVTEERLKEFLQANGKIRKTDEITGIDKKIKTSLKSYNDFKLILNKTHDTKMVEDIIEHIVIFGDDKSMLKEWLDKYQNKLDSEDISSILRFKYKAWGRLSKKLLVGLECEDPKTHEICNIMDELEWNSINLMTLLSNKYGFVEAANEYKLNTYQPKQTISAMIEAQYISPAAKKSIYKAIKLVDEIVDVQKGAPKKIFVEMARDVVTKPGEKTASRKDALIELYKSCKNNKKELYKELYEKYDGDKLLQKLNQETNDALRSDKLYLYYAQFGKCMYSGENIDLNCLFSNDKTYDIDHIFPRSKIKDDSLDNRVLVKTKLNRDKTDNYPISDSIRKNMKPFWSMLHTKKLISDKKYERLIRSTELTEEELQSFVARQLVEVRQSTKALALILKMVYPNTKIVYSKAGNVSSFRQDFKIPKFRDINDLHHAKDAYLNIVVGNVYDTKFTEKFFSNIKNEKYSLNRVFDFNVKNAWTAPTKEEMTVYRELKKENKSDPKTLSGTIQTVYNNVFRNTPIITYVPYEFKGALYDLQLLGKGKGQLSVKKNRDISKYGGYNKRSGTYFTVVRYTSKSKKEEIGIFPVYLMDLKLYEKNPIKYCETKLELKNPKIVFKKMRINSIIEIDDIRYRLVSRTGSSIIYYNTYQLIIDENKAKYIKKLSKYVALCKIKNEELPLSEKSVVTVEENRLIFKYLLEKAKKSVYQKVFYDQFGTKSESEQLEFFDKLGFLNQSEIILNIIQALKCDSSFVDLSKIGGLKTAGRIKKSCNITKYDSVFVVNQSITGLFETKINLLEE